MRTQQFLLSALCLFGIYHFTACRETEKAIPAKLVTAAVATPEPIAAATGYELQPKESFIYWKGSTVTGGGHAGTLRPVSGNLAADAGGKWVGGYFVIDMNTILSTDPDNRGAEDGLVKHLKDPDFFDVPRFPKAYFTMLKATPGANDSSFTITGQLNLKNIVREITFPATLQTTGELIRARASMIIDRTKWGVNYKSGNIFLNLKDDAISDLVPIRLDLVFKKQP